MHSLKMLSALAAVAALALPVSAIAAQDVAPFKVEGRAPTEIRIALRGLSSGEVLHAVRTAADTVCRNAIANRELGIDEAGWCSDSATGRAMKHYAQIVKHNAALADAGQSLVLAVR